MGGEDPYINPEVPLLSVSSHSSHKSKQPVIHIIQVYTVYIPRRNLDGFIVGARSTMFQGERILIILYVHYYVLTSPYRHPESGKGDAFI